MEGQSTRSLSRSRNQSPGGGRGRSPRIGTFIASSGALLLVSCHRPDPAANDGARILADLRARFCSGTSSTIKAQSASILAAGLATGFEVVTGGRRPSFAATNKKTEARVLFPERSTAPMRIEDVASGAGVDVWLQGARDVAPQVQSADGYLIYPHAHASGATVLHRALPMGTEDFISFETRPLVPSVTYKLAVRTGMRGLRLVADTLELLDEGGAPRLRVSPPYLVGADGVQTDATLSVDGCAVDTNPTAPWGRPVTAPGADTCTLRVSWNDKAVVYPALLDPRWTSTVSMATARQEHAATLLSNGKVLVTGGRSSTSTTALSSAELYDRTTGTWTSAGNITAPAGTSAPRRLHTAVQLGTTNTNTSGRVLVAGGINGTTSVPTVSLYNVTANTWAAATTSMNPARHEHTATVLANGNVVVTGGLTKIGIY